MRASEQANLLWPFLIRKVEKVVSGNGNGGGGGSAPTPTTISFFDLTDVEGVGWDDGEVPTWDTTTSTFIPASSLGGSAYTAGDGIDVTGTVISAVAHATRGIIVDSGGIGVKATADGGLLANVDGLYIGLKTDSGLDVDIDGLSVGAGVGISVTGGTVAVDIYSTTSGLAFTTGDLRVDKAADFTWTGQHQFNVDPQISANLDFIGADRTITSSSDLYIVTGDDLILPDAGVFRSDDFADVIPIAGFSLHLNTDLERQLTVNTLKADSIHTRMFVADMVRVDVGEEYWGKSLGILYDNFTVPAVSATTTIIVEDSVRFSGALFSSGDWVMIQAIEGGTGTEFHSDMFWGQVTSYVDLGLDAEGIARQQWTYTHRQGPTGWLIKKGNLVIDFGTTGQGYAHLSVLESAQGPFFRIGEWNGANPYTSGNVTIKTQIGNLDGISDADLNPAGYGLYSENAYLKGVLRTIETQVSDDGLLLEQRYLSSPSRAHISWVNDLSAPGTEGIFEIGSYTTSGGLATDNGYVFVKKQETIPFASLALGVSDSFGDDPGSSITFDNSGIVRISAENSLVIWGNVFPLFDNTHDLGSASFRWGTLYADNVVVSGVISGETIGGQQWEYVGNMTIDANSASSTSVSITNEGTGRADLNVDRDIIVGGTVDGVDIAALDSSYTAHIANANAHHATATAGDGIDITGQAISIGLTALPGLAFNAGNLHVVDYHGITRDANGLSIDLKTTSGLEVDVNGLALADSIAGGGLSITGKVLEVAVGNGIEISSDTVKLNLKTTSGLELDADGVALDDSIAGSGLSITGKVLAVAVTDGIEISADAVKLNLKPTSGMELDATGLALDDAIAGAGLGITNKVLEVGEGDGIDVSTDAISVDVTEIIDTSFGLTANANDIRIDLAANSGLIFSSGDLALGTPSAVSATTTSTVTTTTHTHDATSTSDASGVSVATLLNSTASGGLGLASMFTTGAVDVGQGFTAGNNTIRMIYHTHDYPHTHMVVNPTGTWSLDEQFGLDIDDNLLVRGWIVGKHAIQIAGAEMLVHFDGMPPAESNFTGNPTGHMGQKGTRHGGISFRAGKFGKAVLTGEATTNLVTNPSFETNTTGWATYGTASISRQIGRGTAGDYSLRITVTGGFGGAGSGVEYDASGLAASTTYTISMMVKPTSSASEDICIRARKFSDGSAVATLLHDAENISTWRYVSLTFTTSTSGTYQIRVGYITGGGNIEIDEVQLEQKAYATAYCDGSLGDIDPDDTNDGYDWNGTAHASTSNRAAAYLSYDDESLDNWGDPCTVMVWVKPMGNTAAVQSIVSKANAGNTTGWEFDMSALSLRVILRNPDTDLNSGSNLTVGEWNHCVYTWSGAALKIYLNGVEVGSTTGTSDIVSTNDFLVGKRASGNYFNGLIDEVVLTNRALSEDEVRTIYESEAPVFAETSSWHFRAGRNRIYADAEGLWGYGASGAPILGLYAGEDNNPSATKSWGGKTLSEGDLLLGRYGASDGGWMYFDQDLVGGDPAWLFGYGADEVLRLDSGGASLTGVFDINTNGGIYQGTGTFASPTTGLKIWNASGIGRIGGYNSGTIQWSANTSGKLVAGAGTVVLDENGIDVAITSASAGAANSYNFSSSGTRTAYISGQNAAGVRQINMELLEGSSRDSAIYIGAFAPTGKLGYVNILGYINGVVAGNVQVGRLTGSEPTQVTISRNLQIAQTGGSLAEPTLALIQSDLSEQFVEFTGTVATGNPIEAKGAKTLTTTHFVRVSINGSMRYLQVGTIA